MLGHGMVQKNEEIVKIKKSAGIATRGQGIQNTKNNFHQLILIYFL